MKVKNKNTGEEFVATVAPWVGFMILNGEKYEPANQADYDIIQSD